MNFFMTRLAFLGEILGGPGQRREKELPILVEVRFSGCLLRLKKGKFQPPKGYNKGLRMRMGACYEKMRKRD